MSLKRLLAIRRCLHGYKIPLKRLGNFPQALIWHTTKWKDFMIKERLFFARFSQVLPARQIFRGCTSTILLFTTCCSSSSERTETDKLSTLCIVFSAIVFIIPADLKFHNNSVIPKMFCIQIFLSFPYFDIIRFNRTRI